MKFVFKSIAILACLVLINQVFVLIAQDSIREGWWKSNSELRLTDQDVLEFDSNLKWNVITQGGRKVGIIQLYMGKKILISNTNLTEWYLYEKH